MHHGQCVAISEIGAVVPQAIQFPPIAPVNSASPNILGIVKLPIVTFLTKKDNKVVDSQFIREYSVVGVGRLEKLSGRESVSLTSYAR